MDYKAFKWHFTETCKRRFKKLQTPCRKRSKAFTLILQYLLEISAAHDLEISKVELIERDTMDYVMHVNERICIHCPVIEWQQED